MAKRYLAEKDECVLKSNLLKVTLPADGWSESAPYEQTVAVVGITEKDKPIIGCGDPATLSSENYKALDKNYPYINRVVTLNGAITAYCYTKCPTVDIPLFIKI